MSAPQGPPAPDQPPAQTSGQQTSGPSAVVGPPKPPRVTEGPEIGLPPGVALADLGPRTAAYVIDASVPIVFIIVQLLVGAVRGQGAPTILGVIFAVLDLGWFVFVWWGYATLAAGPGAQVMKLQLVGMSDGRPVGWGRYLVRALIFGLAIVFLPVLIVLLIILARHPRRQGWHDLAVGSVVIKARPLAPRPAKAGAVSTGAPSSLEGPVGDGAQAGGSRGDAEPTVGIPVSDGDPPAPSYGGYGPSGPTASGPPAGLPPPVAHYGPVTRGFGPSNEPSASQSSANEPTESRPAPAPAREDDVVDAAPPAPEKPPATSGAWRLRLDGQEITVQRLVLLGRNPQRGPGEEDAEIVKVKDEARTVSKTHVAFGVDERGLYVIDRGSTNGSAVTSPDGGYRLLQPGEPARIDVGWVVAFGQHELTVSRAG